MIKVTAVTIEGMHSVVRKTYEFKNLNYLHGANGAGKSTALQALQLALLGYIPGCNKRAADIFRHANSHTMAVTANMIDTDTMQQIQVRRIWTGLKSTVSSAVDITPANYNIEDLLKDIELPIFNFNQFVGMTANQLKDWFISFLPKSDTDVDWMKELTEALGDLKVVDPTLIPAVIENVRASGKSGVDAVRHMNEYLKQLKSFKNMEAEKLQSTIQMLVYYDDCIQDADESEIAAEIEDLTQRRNNLVNYMSVEAANQSVQTDLSTIVLKSDCAQTDPDYEAAADRVKSVTPVLVEVESELAKLISERQDISVKIRVLDDRLNQYSIFISTGGVCSYTNEVCPSIVEIINDIKKQYDESKSERDAHSETLASIDSKIAELTKRKSDIQSIFAQAEFTCNQIEAKYNKYALLQSKLQKVPEVTVSEKGVTADIADINEKLKQLNDTLIKLKANQRYNELSDKMTSDMFVIQQSIEAIKIWEKLTSANGLQTRLMKEPFNKLAAGIDTWLTPLFGEGVRAGFYLTEKANSFNFGITRDGSYISYDMLSSGEKCMYTLALMCYIVYNNDTPLKLILIDDMLDHLDDDNISNMFKTLYSIRDIQFIFAGVKDPDLSIEQFEDIVIEVK